jgi:hypothetical protein
LTRVGEKDMPMAWRLRQGEWDFATLVVRGDLDVTAGVNRGINDRLDVGLTLDDLDQHVTSSPPELIDRISLAFGLLTIGLFDSYA